MRSSSSLGLNLTSIYLPWHLLYFLPDPHQQGSLRPSLPAAAPPSAAAAPTGAARRCLGAPLRPALVAPSGSLGPDSSRSRTSGFGGGGGALRCTRTRKIPATIELWMRSRSSLNISRASFLYSTSGSRWPYARSPTPSRNCSICPTYSTPPHSMPRTLTPLSPP